MMDKKKILLFGSTGMAGHIVYYYLRGLEKYAICNVSYRNKLTDDSLILDITDNQAVESLIWDERPDYIINCIGILLKGSKEYPDNAIYINAYFPHALKRISDKIGSKLIHISTDCVFSGKKGHYTESDFRDADDIYGRSKALGEIINSKDLTIRTSIIGPELKKDGEGLFHWFMNQQGTITGYKNAIWGGVTTLELAKAIDYAIENDVAGLVQLSNGMEISKYDLLNMINTIWSKNKHIYPYENIYINKSIAKSDIFDYSVPSYNEMLSQLFEWMTNKPALYDLY